jgi:hypothetical protein
VPLLLEPRSDVVVAPHAFRAAWSSELPFALCDVGRDGTPAGVLVHRVQELRRMTLLRPERSHR